MKAVCAVGDIRKITKTVTEADLATFETGNVHPFYATFSLGRDVEWVCRQFVLDMKGVSRRAAFVVDKDGVVQYAEVLESAGDLPNFDAIKETLSGLN